MSGVVPNNYVNTEMVDNYCFDSCAYKYNYQPINGYSDSMEEDNGVYKIPIVNKTNYACSFGQTTYYLTNIYIILNETDMRHSYERYKSGVINGEFIMQHQKKGDPNQYMNVCIAIKGKTYDYENGDEASPLSNIVANRSDIYLNDFIVSKAYNYYESSDPNSNGTTNWIIFDGNQASLFIDDTLLKIGVSTGIALPNAPDTITSIKYHEMGPQYIATERGVSCTPIITTSDSTSDSKKGFLKKGLFGQKNPIIVSLLLFSFFVLLIGLILGIGSSYANGNANVNVNVNVNVKEKSMGIISKLREWFSKLFSKEKPK